MNKSLKKKKAIVWICCESDNGSEANIFAFFTDVMRIVPVTHCVYQFTAAH